MICVCRFLNDFRIRRFWRKLAIWSFSFHPRAKSISRNAKKETEVLKATFQKDRTLLLGKIQSCNLNEIETTLLQISLKEIFPQTIFFNGNRLKMFMHFHLRLLLWNSLKLCQYHENRVLSSTWLKAVFLSYLDWFLIQEGLKWPNANGKNH